MGKLDVFNKEMNDRIVKFMNDKVWYVEQKATLDLDLKAKESALKAYSEGRLTVGISDDRKTEDIVADILAEIEVRKEEYSNLLADHKDSAFALSDADKAFYKSYKTGKAKEGLVAWFGSFGVKATGEEDISKNILANISGKKKASNAKLAKSAFKTWTADRSRMDVLTVLYSTVCEYSIAKGAIKPARIPDSVRERYLSKKH